MEPERPQATRSSSFESRKPRFLSSAPRKLSSDAGEALPVTVTVSVAIRGSLPFQRPLLPFVDEAHGQHAEEHHHRPEAKLARLAQGDRPGKQKRHLEVEDDEQDRDEIEAHVELAARIAESLESALVGRKLLGIRLLPRQQE